MVEREGGGWMMTFISKMRKRKKQDWVGGVVVGWEEKQQWVRGWGRKKWLICLQSKQAEDSVVFFFLLMPGSGGDRRGVYANERASVYVLPRIVAGLIHQHFLGTREDVGEGPCGS